MAKQGNDLPISRLLVGFLRSFSDQTQADFADASGVYQADVSRYESGDKTPTERTLRRMAAAAGVPWVAVPHLRRFFGGLIEAAQNGSGALPGEDRLERAILEPAFLAVAAYRLDDETAAEDHPPQTMEELACEAEQTWEALERFPVDRRRQVVELLLPRRRSWALAVRACDGEPESGGGQASVCTMLWNWRPSLSQWPSNCPTMPAASNSRAFAGPTLPTRAGYRRTSEAPTKGSPAPGSSGAPGSQRSPAGSPEWRLLSLESSLQAGSRRRFPEALELIDRALALSGSEPAVTAQCLLTKEHAYEVMGDIPSALAVLAQAAPLSSEATGDQHLLPGPPLHRQQTTSTTSSASCRGSRPATRDPRIGTRAGCRAGRAPGRLVGRTDRCRRLGRKSRGDSQAGRGTPTASRIWSCSSMRPPSPLLIWRCFGWRKAAPLAPEVREIAVVYGVGLQGQSVAIQRESLVALQLFRTAADRDAATVELTRQVIAKIEALRRA